MANRRLVIGLDYVKGAVALLAISFLGESELVFIAAPATDLGQVESAPKLSPLYDYEARLIPHHGNQASQVKSYCLSSEVPVAFVYNGISHAVLLATPQDLEDFAIGFSLTEGIIQSPTDLLEFHTASQTLGIELRLRLANRRMHALESRRRSLMGATGCGLCGIDSLEQIRQPRILPDRPDRENPNSDSLVANSEGNSDEYLAGNSSGNLARKNAASDHSHNPATLPFRFSTKAISNAINALPNHQRLNQSSHAHHAAAFCRADGEILITREDIGRHNALDKLVGAMARQDQLNSDGFIIMTSRCSFELVQKTIAAGIKLLVTISAPTEMAVKSAAEAGLCIIAIARSDSMVLFSHQERIIESLA